ncbi:glycosyltransferase family 4 protein [Nocardia sp. NPDC059240]|uniref:glycosyltransferase family 4 protein n=1 Tax=Nocardia sp. NPDC059240 TaxID=3346786 RepID=UPI0036789BC0
MKAVLILAFGWVVVRGVIAALASRGPRLSSPSPISSVPRAHEYGMGSVEFGVGGGATRVDDVDATPHEQRAAGETVIAVVGRLARWEGQDLFLRALADVRVLPREVFLVGGTARGEEGYRGELEVHATALGLPVTFTGEVLDAESYLRHADILVYCPIRAEGFARVMIEGMRAGCAVIATRSGGAEQIIESGVNGVLVSAGQRGELTGALDRLIGDQELRTKLGDAARVRARDFDALESGPTRTFHRRIADIVSRNSR